MNYPKSDCCSAEITPTEYSDKCSSCNASIRYATVGMWARKFHESYAVCQLHNGDYYFFWQAHGSYAQVLESNARTGETYVGQIKQHWSCSSILDKDGDCISGANHTLFSNSWKNKVKNPQFHFSDDWI